MSKRRLSLADAGLLREIGYTLFDEGHEAEGRQCWNVGRRIIESRGTMNVHVEELEGALYRIAQGVEGPEGAARLALGRYGCATREQDRAPDAARRPTATTQYETAIMRWALNILTSHAVIGDDEVEAIGAKIDEHDEIETEVSGGDKVHWDPPPDVHAAYKDDVRMWAGGRTVCNCGEAYEDEGRYSERLGRHKHEEDLDRSLDLADATRGRRTIQAIHYYIDNVPQDAERDVLDDALNHVIQLCRDYMEGR